MLYTERISALAFAELNAEVPIRCTQLLDKCLMISPIAGPINHPNTFKTAPNYG
jgi:hypothetical protein